MEEQQFVLRWHYHETTLLHNLPQLLDSDILTDITLSVGCQSVKAHRLVLATCSSYFLQLFQEMGPLHHPVIIINNTNLDNIKAVLSFIYRGQCIVSKGQLPNVLAIARLLKIQGLCDMQVPDKLTIDVNSNKSAEDTNLNKKLIVQQPKEILDKCIEQTKDVKDRLIVQNETSTCDFKSIADDSIQQPSIWNSTSSQNVTKIEDNNLYGIPPLRKATRDISETCKCFLCGKYLSNQYNLRVHMETHEEAYHACHSCPHVSRSRDALRKHISYRHPEEYRTKKRKKCENASSNLAN